MRIARVVGTVLVCAAVSIAAWLGWAASAGALGYRPLTFPAATDGVRPWIGAVHVHTELSGDASGTVAEIAAAAARAGLDFVLVADHTRALGDAGRIDTAWHGSVLVISGAEISTDSGHLLAVGLRPHPFALGPSAAQALDDIDELGGSAYIAHPTGGETAWRGGWMRARGAEIASLSSALKVASTRSLLAAALLVPINREAAAARLAGGVWGGLPAWDQRTSMSAPLARPLVGLGAVDAHGPVLAGFPDYETAFRSLATMVWMPESPDPGGDARAAAATLARQLSAGRVATVLTALGSAPGLTFRAERGGGRVLEAGEMGRARGGTSTFVGDIGAAGPYRMDLLRDGAPVASVTGGPLVHETETAGTYRLQVFRTDVPGVDAPWIVTNPVYLWTDEAAVAARQMAVPPLPLPVLDADLLTSPGWAAESDIDSGSDLARSEHGLRWDLRIAEVEREDAYAALSWRPPSPVDWQGVGGLGVRLRTERSMRVSLRVWTRDDGGAEQTWERVVRADAEPPGTAVSFEAFRRIDELPGAATVGIPPLALARVSGVALVLTPQRLRPGTVASVQVEIVGTYPR